MTTQSNIIKYMPLHELTQTTSLSSDDLLLVSKVSRYATDDENAVTVSMKISYSDLLKQISSDLGL